VHSSDLIKFFNFLIKEGEKMYYERKVYTLIKKDLPKITGKTILVDNNKGGELLVYHTHQETFKEFRILWFKFEIIVLKTKPKEIVILRPFKKNWNVSKHKLSPNYWGKKNNPLTNLWCVMKNDFTDTIEESNEVIDYIDNKLLIRYLKKHTNKFTIELNQFNNNSKS
jgi:hypothetical protein